MWDSIGKKLWRKQKFYLGGFSNLDLKGLVLHNLLNLLSIKKRQLQKRRNDDGNCIREKAAMTKKKCIVEGRITSEAKFLVAGDKNGERSIEILVADRKIGSEARCDGI
ncbi:hypothetical protein L195_g058176 [Trifolium pratense]|uniref:Uncharacterized protein n=1 Tax=Trifolium pratense TaxID=57577 RepID=A0A2K3JQS7_TRIPR|nr:hypothetical protein L195_g058176 [Trifolium pratense]